MILAPVVVNRKGEHLELFVELRAQGLRARARRRQGVRDRRGAEARQDHASTRSRSSSTGCKVRAEFKQRLAESYETALRNGDGRAIAVEMDTGRASTCSRPSSRARSATTRWPSSSRGCSRSTTRSARARAATASARSASSIRSASSRFPQLSLASGAIKGWDRRNQFYFQMLQSLAKHVGFDLERPFAKLPERVQSIVLYGSRRREDPVHLPVRARQADDRASTRSKASSRTSSGATARPTR